MVDEIRFVSPWIETKVKKVKFCVGNVGWQAWEEIHEAGMDYAGKNYGWPTYEGPCLQVSSRDCPVPDSNDIVDPVYYYQHKTKRGGGAITGSAFVPEILWPSDYKFLFIDFKDQARQPITIKIGGPPTGSITSPSDGSQFYSGQMIRLFGEATDSRGNVLDCSQIKWEVRKHHASHFHPFLDRISGNDLDLFSAPEPEDYVAATNSYLEIIMYATDDDGLATETSRHLYPSLVYIDVNSSRQGLQAPCFVWIEVPSAHISRNAAARDVQLGYANQASATASVEAVKG